MLVDDYVCACMLFSSSLIPLLKQNGVQAITVGVNGASMPPAVPNIFRWKDPISNEEVLAMWHPGGYGGQVSLGT